MKPYTKEKANLLRWNGRRGWFEVYFLKWNDPKSRTAAWLRYTLTSPRRKQEPPYCELWGVFFDADQPSNKFAIKQRYPIHQLAWEHDSFQLRIAEASLNTNSCEGKLFDQDRGHSLAWKLEFDSAAAPFFHFPWLALYRSGFPRTKLLAPHINARFSGKLSVNGRDLTLEQVPGQQEHLWGSKHAFRYSWGHCNSFEEDPTAIWEGLDAQIRIGPLTCPHLKLFYLKSKSGEYLFNSPLMLVRNRSDWKLGIWDFMAQNRKVRLLGRLRCSTDRFIGLTYTDPNGDQLWCHNSKIGYIQLLLYGKNGKLLEKLTSDCGCAIEHLDRRPHPLVPFEI